jgi:hypothetical protein
MVAQSSPERPTQGLHSGTWISAAPARPDLRIDPSAAVDALAGLREERAEERKVS